MYPKIAKISCISCWLVYECLTGQLNEWIHEWMNNKCLNKRDIQRERERDNDLARSANVFKLRDSRERERDRGLWSWGVCVIRQELDSQQAAINVGTLIVIDVSEGAAAAGEYHHDDNSSELNSRAEQAGSSLYNESRETFVSTLLEQFTHTHGLRQTKKKYRTSI